MSHDDYDFEALLERSMGEIQPPKTAPEGTWELEVISGKLRKGRGGENGPIGEVIFPCRLVKAYDDVNEAALTQFGDEGIRDTRVYLRMPIFERRDEWSIRRFVEKTLGVSGVSNQKLPQVLETTKGNRFVGFVRHRANEKDPEGPPNVDVTSPRALEI